MGFIHDETRLDAAGISAGIGGFLRSLLAGVPWSESAQCEDDLTLNAPSTGRLGVSNPNGGTRIIGEDRQDIAVHAQKRARAESQEAAEALLGDIKILSTETDGALEIEVEMPRKWNRHGHADMEVRVPRGLQVAIVTVNGKICAEGLRGRLRARSTNGAVRIVDIVGDIKVETSNAKVSCRCTCGRLQARSSNGRIQLEEHRGSIDATTSNGLIHASLEKMGEEGIRLATSNGRIVLNLPEEVDADVDVRVDNGVIRNHRHFDACRSDKAGRLLGRLGCGGSVIRLRTSNGTISLR